MLSVCVWLLCVVWKCWVLAERCIAPYIYLFCCCECFRLVWFDSFSEFAVCVIQFNFLVVVDRNIIVFIAATVSVFIFCVSFLTATHSHRDTCEQQCVTILRCGVFLFSLHLFCHPLDVLIGIDAKESFTLHGHKWHIYSVAAVNERERAHNTLFICMDLATECFAQCWSHVLNI